MKFLLTALLLLVSLVLNGVLVYRLWSAPPAVQISNTSRDMVVMRTPGGLLEVSTITSEERFDSTTDHTILGVPVGRTVSQIRVPAVYRYHIPLAPEWEFHVAGNTLVVVAPPVQAALPVAIDTGKLESFSSGLWSPFTGASTREALQRSITGQLASKAASAQLVLLQRESARQTVGEFVRKWVLEQPRWKDAATPTVFVFFTDEPLGKQAIGLLKPSPGLMKPSP